MSIPTVPGSEQANTPVRNVPMEAGQFMAGRGSAAMGEALGNVSDVLGGYAQAEAKARTAMTLADADRLMRQSRSEFINGLQGDTNEEEWRSKWQQKQEERKDAILSGNKVSPAARRQLKLMFTDWEGASNVEIQTMARRQLANRGHAKILLAVDEAERDGDEAGAARYLQAGVGGHLF